MEQSGNNHLLLRASQPGQLTYSGSHAGPPGPPAATDRMRELLARTVQEHIGQERDMVSALQEVRRRLDTLEQVTLAGVAAAMDGIAASLGALDSKLAARLERLDERLDDQYDRVRAIDSALGDQAGRTEEIVAKAVEAATGDIAARLASLEDTVLTLAEALLRPALRYPCPPEPRIPEPRAAENGQYRPQTETPPYFSREDPPAPPANAE